MPIAGNVDVPVRRFVASVSDRQESVVYWSRIGEAFPTDGPQQRLALLEAAMHGVIVDGLLARFSTIDPDLGAAMHRVDGFIRDLLRATPPSLRAPLIGTARRDALREAGF
jgi:EpsI family protein